VACSIQCKEQQCIHSFGRKTLRKLEKLDWRIILKCISYRIGESGLDSYTPSYKQGNETSGSIK
jgi:hypothetical protein